MPSDVGWGCGDGRALHSCALRKGRRTMLKEDVQSECCADCTSWEAWWPRRLAYRALPNTVRDEHGVIELRTVGVAVKDDALGGLVVVKAILA